MVRLAATIRRYIGTSREIKPHVGTVDVATGVVLTEIPVGSIFEEEETGFRFVYNGETWEPDPQTAQTILVTNKLEELLRPMLAESKKQTGLLKDIVADIPEEAD